ncbi:cytochrome P450 [Artemisia annua]|uniref:Cytochrome P450 n=1 Tax=Artemisia annua TaxID=35608 RepID=A0A2U1MES0_ARTAN|nr:cytochrome P450 [Artemisia annua]
MVYLQYGRSILRHSKVLKDTSESVLHHPLFYAAQGVRYRKLEVILTTLRKMISHIQWPWYFVLLTCSIITFAILWCKFSSKARLPPGPRGLPLLGYLPFLDPNLHHGYTKLAQRYGPIFMLKLGSKTHIVVSSSDLAKVVLREQDEIFANRDPPIAGTVISYGGQSIVWSDSNSLWRNMRKVISYEVLSNKNLQASSTFRQGGVTKAIKHVYETMGTEVDIGGIAFLTSLNVITSIVWGKSLVEDVKSTNLGVEFREAITKIVELLGAVNVSDLFPVLSRFDLQGVEREMKRQRKIVDAIFERIIKERIANKPEEVVVKIGRKDFLQILLELKEQKAYTSLNITQIKALLMDIFFGTTDPTSTMVEWTMAELLKNPSMMQKVKDELKEVVGLNNIVQESHLSNLKYLDAVVKETFRLHPPVPLLVVRCPNESCNIAGYTVPKGANVYVNVWAIHRDSQYWDNPLEFNPNRFLSVDDGTTKFDYNGYNPNFIPFGSGRRMCPGVPLGEKMLVYFLASMLHSFDWTLPNGELELSDKFGIVLKKNTPLMAIASQRLPDKTLYM